MEKKIPEKKVLSFRKTISHMWGYLKPYKVGFIIVIILRFITAGLSLYPAFAYAKIIDFLTKYEANQSLYFLCIIFITYVVVAFLRFVTKSIASCWGYSIATKANHDSEQKVIEHLLKLDMSWHEHRFTGGKMKRIGRGSNGLDRMIRLFVSDVPDMTVGILGILIIIGSFSLYISLLLVLFIVSYVILSTYFQKKGVAQDKLVAVVDEHRGGIVYEVLNNIRTIKILNVSESFLESIITQTQDLYQKIKKRIFYFNFGGQFSALYGTLFFIGSIAFVSYEVINGRFTLGFLILFYGYFDHVWGEVARFASISEGVLININEFERMQLLLEEKPSIDIGEGKVSFPKDWSLIGLKNLSFKYGENQVLNSINLDIKRGQKIGIVGLSGAGKSTLFKLLSKENESYEGEIDVDGIPLKTISKSDYLNNATVVLQETELFNNSLAFNITFGTNPDKELLEKAITTSHVREFVAKLKDGLETVVGEKGVKLSGGEKQRVGIARAVYKNPQILLMDEATSHLDIESEKKIQDSLHEFFKSVTAIVIAHRLTTIKEMDTIVLIEDGKISEQGSFDELYAKQGRFFELWSKQKL